MPLNANMGADTPGSAPYVECRFPRRCGKPELYILLTDTSTTKRLDPAVSLACAPEERKSSNGLAEGRHRLRFRPAAVLQDHDHIVALHTRTRYGINPVGGIYTGREDVDTVRQGVGGGLR